MTSPDHDALLSAFAQGEKMSGAFLDATTAAILESRPRIVGFTLTFAQSLCAAALARRIKEAAPGILTVIGGLAATPPLGPALAECSGSIDLIFSGEADRAFPEFCRDYLAGRRSLPASGIIEGEAIDDLDSLPSPDYNDYFKDLAPLRAAGRLSAALPNRILFESSRGCWWGETRQCLFCSFRPETRRFRRKSARRVIAELRRLAARHGVGRFYATDNIMPREFFRDLLPALAAKGAPFELFYEIKAGLEPEQLEILARAGVRLIQPGIESLITPLLKVLRKGVTGPQNLRLLRECRRRRLKTLHRPFTCERHSAARVRQLLS